MTAAEIVKSLLTCAFWGFVSSCSLALIVRVVASVRLSIGNGADVRC